GVGVISAVGHTAEETWAGLLAGRSGFGDFSLIPRGEHVSGGVCEVKAFDPAEAIGRRDARRRDRCQQLATVAANEAMGQASLPLSDGLRERTGVFVGTGVGGISTLVEQQKTLMETGLRRLSPFGVTMIMPNGSAGMLGIDYGLTGPNITITTACAAGNDAIGHAFRAIRRGELDAALTGGTESVMTSVAIGGFEQAGATSKRTSGTPRPFDRDRDGLVVGEGAGMLVLEHLELALARGATILGEIVGYAATSDAFHITAPAEGGLGAARAILLALQDAGIAAEEVDYVSAHGTATPLNDANETQAIKAALGEHAYDVAVSSTKSMTGHVMGATGAMEAVFSLLAIRDQTLPPTINYETPDPDCDLDYIPNKARPAQFEYALSNSFGFGGTNAALLFRRYSE
ncbi:MAG: beta-ketoacyl-ACP synthase II, partial [Candidatus Promineifilaceae bacterium]